MALESIKNYPRYQDQKNLIPFGYNVYSQGDEDGIIREIFNRIGVTNKTFVEVGVGNGLENNTLALLFEGWKGLWIEESERWTNKIERGFKNTIAAEKLHVINAFVTKDNINELLSSKIDEQEIDLLSIDIDGNDFYIFEAINYINPRVVVIEYNAKFPPPINYCMSYYKNYVWEKNDNFGASLKFLEVEFDKRNYSLVGCNLFGINAFFVRKDLVANKFLEPFSAEVHYEPARYYLASISAGHKASYKALENSQTDQ